jgi:PadR family transcriptional regulator, regulatory protein PadR
LRPFFNPDTFLSQGSFPDAKSPIMDLSEKFGPIRKGLLEFALLRVIAAEKLYVAEMLQRLAATEFATQEGTLYPLLSRLRREGLVDYEWQESGAGPPRKYYKLTEQGRRALDELAGYWHHLHDTLTRLGH